MSGSSKPKPKNSRTFSDLISDFRTYIAQKISGKRPKTDLEISFPEMENNLRTFAESTVGDIIIPRSDICAVSINWSLEEVCKSINSKSHTRVLVYEGDLDTIIGFLHIKDVFKIISEKKAFNIRSILRDHIITTNATKLIDILGLMKKRRVHIAIVADEYGGTDGMITIEDVTERLLGPINDEHDVVADKLSYQITKNGSIIVSSRTKIEDLINVINFDLGISEEGDYDTVGGLIMARIGHMPKIGEKIIIADKVSFEIIEATARQIKQVKVVIL